MRSDEVGERGYRLLELVDLGDFVGVGGRVMRTRKGELTVQASELVFLSKALLPPPEKWHGLSDVEVRYRQRYVDLIANPEVRGAFLARSRMVRAHPPLPRRARLRRGRDADDAADRGRRRGAAVRHAPQRARHRPLPAHRARALPEAAGGRRLRARLRDQSQLPQRGALVAAQPRVHDARVLHGLLRLPRRHRDHRGAGREGGARRRRRPAVVPRPRGLVRARPSSAWAWWRRWRRSRRSRAGASARRELDDPAALEALAAGRAAGRRSWTRARRRRPSSAKRSRGSGCSRSAHGKRIAHLFEVWVERRWDRSAPGCGSRRS